MILGEGDEERRQRPRESEEKQRDSARAAIGEMVEGKGKAKRYIYIYIDEHVQIIGRRNVEVREMAKMCSPVEMVKRNRTKKRKRCGSTRKEVPQDAVVHEREKRAEKTEER